MWSIDYTSTAIKWYSDISKDAECIRCIGENKDSIVKIR